MESTAQHQHATHPISNAPIEVLTQIFLASDHDHEPEGHTSDPSRWNYPSPPNFTPLALSHVCGIWRELALSIPSLWTTIRVTLSDDALMARSKIPLTSLLLERSKEHPITIYLNARPKAATTDGSMMNLLVQHSHRWARLDVKFKPGFIAELQAREIQHMLPILRSLKLSGGNYHYNQAIDTFASAPALRHLTLVERIDPPHRLSIPTRQLRTLNLEKYPFDNLFLELISGNFPILERCTFKFCHRRHGFFYGQVTMPPSVRELRFRTDASRSCMTGALFFFEHLLIPSVTYIKLSHQLSRQENKPYPHAAFVQMLSNSSACCRVQTLSLSGTALRDEALLAVLDALPSLTTFKVTETSSGDGQHVPIVSDDLLRRLAERCLSRPAPHELEFPCFKYLPWLERIVFKGVLNFDDDVLVDMVEARWHATDVPRCLKSVTLQFSDIESTMNYVAYRDLQGYKAEGLKLWMNIHESPGDVPGFTSEW